MYSVQSRTLLRAGGRLSFAANWLKPNGRKWISAVKREITCLARLEVTCQNKRERLMRTFTGDRLCVFDAARRERNHSRVAAMSSHLLYFFFHSATLLPELDGD